jgi:hypothetical protein
VRVGGQLRLDDTVLLRQGLELVEHLEQSSFDSPYHDPTIKNSGDDYVKMNSTWPRMYEA